MRKITVIIALFLAAIQIVSAQKVGLVLSGGGAKGAAHIGVIKRWKKIIYRSITLPVPPSGDYR